MYTSLLNCTVPLSSHRKLSWDGAILSSSTVATIELDEVICRTFTT
jgi:hypothetical protein